MKPTERRSEIMQIVQQRGKATVDGLAQQLAISRETIRRDLTALDAEGKIRKFHGGARAVGLAEKSTLTESRFAVRMDENIEAKHAIGKYAASLFKKNDVIFIDSGSTTIIFSSYLKKMSDVTIITNSPKIAEIVGTGGNNNRIFLIGGDYDAESCENLGTLAIQQIEQFHADHVVLTVGAISKSGARDFDLREAEIARAMIANSQMVTVLADASKFLKVGTFDVASTDHIDRLITDQASDEQVRRHFLNSGVDLFVATT